MINDSQDVTRTSADERVIQSRAHIDQHQRTAKDRATGNLPGGSTHRSDHQYNRSCESERRPDAMRDGVRDDVAQPVFRHHRKMIKIRAFSRRGTATTVRPKDSRQVPQRAKHMRLADSTCAESCSAWGDATSSDSQPSAPAEPSGWVATS